MATNQKKTDSKKKQNDANNGEHIAATVGMSATPVNGSNYESNLWLRKRACVVDDKSHTVMTQ